MAVSLLETIKNGGTSLPQSSLIHLILVRALLIADRAEESLVWSTQLITTLQVSLNCGQPDSLTTIRERAVLATMCVLAALAALQVHRPATANQLVERYTSQYSTRSESHLCVCHAEASSRQT